MRIAIAAFLLCLMAGELSAADRIVAASPTLVEIVCALGGSSRLAGVSEQSDLPPGVNAPTIGHERTLAPEGILALDPDLLLVTDSAGPPLALSQLEQIGVRVAVLPAVRTIEEARARIAAVAETIDADAGDVQALLDRFDHEVESARRVVGRFERTPRVLFLYARGGGHLLVSGEGTAAAAMIELAAGRNCVRGFEDYRPLTAESLVEAAPEVILMTEGGVASVGGEEAIWSIPGLSETPAGKSRALVVMDDVLLLGFGPRAGAAISELAERIHQWNR
jgi:iron complex transport system substrate-binding protein